MNGATSFLGWELATLIHYCNIFCIIMWTLAIVGFFLKFLSKDLDELTTYGKLQGSNTTGLLYNETFWQNIYWISAVFHSILSYFSWIYLGEFQPRSDLFLFQLLFFLQLMRRSFETRFIHVFTKRKVNNLNVIFGFGYYFFVISSSIIGSVDQGVNTDTLSILQISGILFFFIGAYVQTYSHTLLAKQPKVKGYKPPSTGLFPYTLCPHYLGEIIVYFSFVLLFNASNLNLWLILLFVIANLTNTAYGTKQLYMKYDSQAKYKNISCLFPGIF